MKNGELRIVVIILTAVLTVAILCGGYFAYNVYGVEKPLEEELSSLQQVSSVVITKDKKTYEIKIQLEPQENLQSAYSEIQDALNRHFKGKDYELQIADNRNEKIELFYLQMQPAVQQAAAQSEFVWLDNQFREQCEQMALTYNLMVDEQNIYIQIINGSDYLYEVVPRPEISKTKQ